jgi:hypothetical protein
MSSVHAEPSDATNSNPMHYLPTCPRVTPAQLLAAARTRAYWARPRVPAAPAETQPAPAAAEGARTNPTQSHTDRA